MKARQSRHLAMTRKWSALLKLLAVDGPNPGRLTSYTPRPEGAEALSPKS